MGKIHVLDTSVSNKIAAGEVVERPASVVKELVENSIDAGAGKITVEIKNGGSIFIRITDNGSGMSAEDASIAFLRHATSKISEAEDLDAIYTFGFRGEALSSIGAVSKAQILTKRADDELASLVICEGGKIVSKSKSGAANGTVITVENLFYNTPARMKFMKKDSTEAGYISDIMTRFILAHPEISFKYISNGKEQLFSPGDGSLINAVYSVYGRDYAKAMLDVDYESDGIHITGVIGKGTLARPNRNFQSFFVNKRYIKSAIMIKAAEEAYKNQIMIGKFPVLALNIEINPAKIDINVHPTKLEIKFSDEKQIYEAVYYGVKNALYAIPNVPELQVSSKKSDESNIEESLRNAMKGGKNEHINPFLIKKQEKPQPAVFKKENTNSGQTEFEDIITKPENKSQEKINKNPVENSVSYGSKPDPFSAFRKSNKEQEKIISAAEPVTKQTPILHEKQKTEPFIPKAEQQLQNTASENIIKKPTENKVVNDYIKITGQIFDTYIIAQRGENEMLIIDQHAAHERIKFEEIKRAAAEHKMYTQMLLEPVIISLSSVEMSAFEQNKNTLGGLGFECDEFGDCEIIVRAAPAEIEWADIEPLVIELLTECMDNRKELQGARQERFLYTVACKAAIKANHILSTDEMKKLTETVLSLENINTCPHGRPIMISMTKKELEKQFKRIV